MHRTGGEVTGRVNAATLFNGNRTDIAEQACPNMAHIAAKTRYAIFA
jgi:hypothetical protein